MNNLKLILLTLVISVPVVGKAQPLTMVARKQLVREWTEAGNDLSDLEEIVLSSAHTSSISGITHLYFQQSYRGIPIQNGLGSIHLDPDGKIQYFNLQFYDHLVDRIGAVNPVLDPERARAIAESKILNAEDRPGWDDHSGSGRQIQVPRLPKLQYVEDASGALLLAYAVALPAPGESDDRYTLWINAENGEEVQRLNRTLYCHFESEAHPAPVVPPGATTVAEAPASSSTLTGSPVYFAFPREVESPAYGERRLMPASAIVNSDASPLGWHKTDQNSPELGYTRGNNVYAYYAPLGSENPDPVAITRAALTGNYLFGNVPMPDQLKFDYRRDLYQTVANNFVEDAVTNLFVRTNFMHDLLFQYGFDEAAGNFQTTNLSGEGIGGDHVLAHAQDGLGMNQASFSYTPDGESPNMRMFLWNTDLPNSTRDGSFENLIIAHEYSHGLSFRLVGGSNDATCLSNFEQGGEGWSDYIGLMMTMTDRNGNQQIDEHALGEGIRGVGHYLLSQNATEAGMRTRHYTTNMDCENGTCNEFTYEDLLLLAPPHGVGFLWCTMLWDMTWNLINEYGYEPDLYNTASSAGNIRALKIVIEALKMTPCKPSFIDMRNAILAANDAIFDGEAKDLIWAAFARRGLGYSAEPGGIAAFDDPYMRLIKTVDKTSAAVGEAITYTLSITNNSPEPLKQTIVSDQLPEHFVVTHISDNGIQHSDGLVQWPKVTIPKKQTIIRTITGHLNSSASPTAVVSEYPVELTNLVGFAPVGAWLASTDYPNPNSNSTASWFHLNPDRALESSLLLTLNLDGSKNNHLSFWQSYDTEPGADGGVVEVLVDKEWQDLGEKMIKNGYNSMILDEFRTPVGLPIPLSSLSRRRVFSGYSQGYRQTIIDLSGYEGMITIRFRFVANLQTENSRCDGSTRGCDGWYIDDVQVLDLQNLPNTACATSEKSMFYACGDIGPIGTVFQPATENARVRQTYETELQPEAVRIYPNPARNQMTVQLPVWEQDQPELILLQNGQGQTLETYRIPEGESTLQIDGSQLPRGLYFLAVQGRDRRSVHRVVFQ